MPRQCPTDAQFEILTVLWRLGPSTVCDVHEALPPEQARGYTTTLKLMQIMAEQGLVGRDETTGQSYLKLPMPEPDTVQKIVGLLGGLIKTK